MAPTESEIGNTVPFGTKVSKFLSHACCGIIFYPSPQKSRSEVGRVYLMPGGNCKLSNLCAVDYVYRFKL